MPLRDGQGTTPASDSAVAERIGNGQVVEFDDFIEAQLRKTRGHVRSVDIATGLMLLAAGTLAYILLAAVFDHWIVTGGLGFWGRTFFLVVYLVAAGAYLASSVLPLLLRRINPLYAAETIERSHPTLKNALVNFLFFRGHRERLSPVIYQAVEEQAARNLAGTQADTAVDRTQLIRIGYLLLGILLACAVYALVSPKNMFRTVGRIAVPWAEIDAPTRTTITEIEPRDAQAFRGQQIAVSARIKDLPADAPVRLIYTTADGQTVDRAIEMTPGEDGYKHACLLPEGDSSLQQDLEYRIEAGDAITRPFHLDVVAAPTIFVEAVETKYPAYTGLLAQRVERQGDVKAIEGSQITIAALANSDIRTAHVDFDCDGSLDQRMTVAGRRAKVTFPLALADDRRTAKHSSYQLVFTNEQGQRNPQPVRHQIEVTRDIPPEIAFVAPTNDPIDVPVNGALTLEVVAIDPDFALGLVKLSIAQGEKPLADKLLVSDTHRGQFVGKYRFEPQQLGLKPGDLLTYSAVAEDNKDPNPNRTSTASRRIRVTAPGEQQGQQDQVAQNDGAGEGRSQPDDGTGKRPQSQRDANLPPDENAGKPGAEPQDASDKAAQSGESGDGQPAARGGDRQPGEQQPSPGEQKPGEQQGDTADSHDPTDQGRQQGDQAGTKQQGENGKSGDASQAAPAGEQGEQQGAGNNESGSSDDSSVSSDGSNDGDAIERILEHRDQNQPASDQQPGDQRQQQDDDQQVPDAKSSGRDESQTQQGAKSRESAKRQDRGDQRPSDESQGEPAGEKPAGEQGAGGNKQRDAVPGERQSANQDRSDGKSGEPAQRDDTASASKQGKQPHADQQQGEAGEKKAGDERDKATDADETEPGESQPKPGQRGGQEGAKQGQSGEQAQRQQGADQKGAGQKGADQNDAQSADKQPGDKQAAERKSQTNDQGDQHLAAEDGQGQGESKDGQGAQSKNDPMGNKNAPSRDAQRSDAKGGDGEQQKGEAGTGQKSTDKQGSPSPQETAKPRDKSQPPTPGDQDAKDPNDAQSPSQTQNESDSQGQDDGDRSGGGKRGGGQKANKPGTGGAGQNTAADEGAGASEQAGDGETSDRAGDDKAAEGPTGKSGDQRGNGSQSQPAGENDGEPAGNGSSGEDGAKGDTPKSDSSDTQATPGGGTPTGGKPGDAPDDGTPIERPYRTAPEAADEANLDYARKATDLALSHLKDELAKDQPDAKLLKDLGWTRDDLQKFVGRWEQMRRDAQTPGAKGEMARRELDETLQSLGLRPRATSLRANDARDDAVKGMRESRRSSPPPEYAEQVKAYTQGTARGGK